MTATHVKPLQDLLGSLNDEQRAALKTFGVDRHLLWKWNEGLRLPTEVQVAYLALVTRADWAALQRAITLARTPAEHRPAVEGLLYRK